MSQNLRVAMWIPADRINRGESIIAGQTVGPGQVADTTMGVSTGGGGAGGGGSGDVHISTGPPATPVIGDMWVDVSNPAAPQVKVYKQGNAWVIMSTGPSLPQATKADEFLESGTGPSFDWETRDEIYLGNY
jgi:hypothetical protein